MKTIKKTIGPASSLSKDMKDMVDDRTGSMTGAPSPRERAAMDKKPMTKKKK